MESIMNPDGQKTYRLMSRRILRVICLVFAAWPFMIAFASATEPTVRILSPKDGSQISQDQNLILVSGNVSTQAARISNVDIVFVLDVSGSTRNYAGVDFSDSADTLPPSGSWGLGRPQVGMGGIVWPGRPSTVDLRNSIIRAEVAATRRLLSQLNSATTRVGLVTFSDDARVLQPLTHDFEQVRRSLDEILIKGPDGGTHMAAGVRLGIKELMGLGQSERRTDAVKVQFLLTDGLPSLPFGRGGDEGNPQDTNLAINAGRLSGKAGIKVHVFGLGREAISEPRAAVGIARESGGIFTPVVRPADILRVLENVSILGVEHVQVFNETTGQKASQLRLAADGFYSAAVPVIEGLNRIQVLARSSDGGLGRQSISIDYRRSEQRALDLDIFLERERSLQLQVERLGNSGAKSQPEADRSRDRVGK
ncbi:MAG: VWA domain-containing protein [Deltaproteobacteria bacterium]|nr:VWA domain-containing protein [Deltaproteobacteria bacterium]